MVVINKESLGSPAVAKHTEVSGLHDVEKSPCYVKVLGKIH